MAAMGATRYFNTGWRQFREYPADIPRIEGHMRAAIPIAPRALYVRSVTRTVAGNNQPMCCETSAAVVLWSEPCLTLGRVGYVEAADGRSRVALHFPLTSHLRDVVANFVISRAVAYCHRSRADS